jgi:predicted secreted protein with PEFG-CTERM motif
VKLKNLQKIMILPSLIFVACFLVCLPAFGQGIELENIKTNPSQIHVGDSFQINATVVNDSPSTIYFDGGCLSPLSAIFDKNVAVGQAMGCFAIFNADLKPGQNTTVVAPSQAISYTANSSGTTNANVTFSYQTENKSESTISKLFTFAISERTPIPEFPSIASVVFTVATMSAIVVIYSRKNHSLFKL